jgi:hypothetical protein
MPRAYKIANCDECGKEMRASDIARHKKSHARRVLITELKNKEEKRANTLKAQLKTVIGKENLEKLLHVYYRTDCFAENKSAEDVEKNFEIEHDLHCSCGVGKECDHPHTHMLAYWKGVNETHKYKVLGPCFTENLAYQTKAIGSAETLEKKIAMIKHFIHTACYIQTLRGWHKKTSQKNPHVFNNLEENKRFLRDMYKEWMWAQVSYMRYLDKEMDKLHRKIEFAMEEDRITRLKEKLFNMDEKMQDLEKIWGEEHHYTDEEMEKDLDDFINECKGIGNPITA